MLGFMQKGDECMTLFLKDADDTISLFERWEFEKMIFDELVLLHLVDEVGVEVFLYELKCFEVKGQIDVGVVVEFNRQSWDILLWWASLNFIL